MIGGLSRAFDNLFGRGEAVVTVPPLDGAMRPNRLLDEADSRLSLDDVDCLTSHNDRLIASAGANLLELDPAGEWAARKSYDSRISCMTAVGADGLAIALDSGQVVIEGGPYGGRRYRVDASFACITAMASRGNMLFVANGSATNEADAWQRDLLERNASGAIWQIDLDSGTASRLADGLAWPAGVACDGDALVVSEAWKHQLVRIDLARPDRPRVLHGDLPGYPGRLSPVEDGYWLAMFAPRSQLVEFVLREPAYRKRMMAEVPPPFWVAPRLRSGHSFCESLQGGGVKHLGMLKPWAPTMSAGLCVKLDGAFRLRFSLQSRADGRTHGVTCAVEHQGKVYVAARGDGVVVSLPLPELEADRGGRR